MHWNCVRQNFSSHTRIHFQNGRWVFAYNSGRYLMWGFRARNSCIQLTPQSGYSDVLFLPLVSWNYSFMWERSRFPFWRDYVKWIFSANLCLNQDTWYKALCIITVNLVFNVVGNYLYDLHQQNRNTILNRNLSWIDILHINNSLLVDLTFWAVTYLNSRYLTIRIKHYMV